MSSGPQGPVADPKKIKKLLENHTAREAFEILAAQIILANERTRDPLPRSRVQIENSKTNLIKLTAKDLDDLRTGLYGRIQLPSQEEARHWLQQWREGVHRGRRRMLERSSQRGNQQR